MRLRMARGRRGLAAALALALGLGLPAGAQEMRKYGEVDTATVVAVDAEAARIVIDTQYGARTFVVEPVTRILRGDDAVELDAVSVGDRVVVEAHDEVGDDETRLIADRILVVVDEDDESAE